MAGDARAEYVIERQQQMENDRVVYDSHCQEIAERVLPRQDTFTRKRGMEGEKRAEKIFDATAPLALDRAASAIDSLITPTTQQYHKLGPEDDRLQYDRDTVLYCDELTKQLFRMRYRPEANYSSQAHECYVSLMAFGTLAQFTNDELGIGTRYKSIGMSQMYIAEDHAGVIDYNHRKFKLAARQAAQKFGLANLPQKIRDEAEKHPFQKFEFIHCVKPNEERVHSARGYKSWPHISYYVSYEGRKCLSEGGYRTKPYQVSRHVTAPDETYGRSPAMIVLADIKMLNEMEKTTIRAAHKVVDPPLLAFGDGFMNIINTRPNAINYGGVDANGRQLVHPLKTGANLPLVFEMSEGRRKVINDAFYVTLFQILVQNPQMTATEALIRAQEKGQLLAPTVGRQESEYLGPQILRELDILALSGRLPQMPRRLAMSGGGLKVIYTSPLARLRRAEDGVAMLRSMESATSILQAKPDSQILDNIDEDAWIREMWEINGAPLKVLRPSELVDQIREERKQAQQNQATLDGANTAANAAKNLAKAQESVGTMIPPGILQ